MSVMLPVSLLLAIAASSSPAAGLPPLVPVFTPGEAGISCWRIPAVVQSQQVLLAFAEARISSCTDNTEKMMGMKRSTDRGATWSAARFIVKKGLNGTWNNSVWNPEPVVDEATGTVVLAYLINRYNCLSPSVHCAAFTITSHDAGLSWGYPQSLEPALGSFANGVRPGPGRALQLDVGPHAGRLLWSGSYDQIPKRPGERTVDIIWYSDDGGKTMQLSKGHVMDGDESSLIQLGNGSLLLNIRPAIGSKCHCRAVSRSDDGGLSWSNMAWVPELISSRCQGSTMRPRGQSAVFFSNPSNAQGRVNMTVKRSDDAGATFPKAVVVYPDASAYSCLTTLPQTNSIDSGSQRPIRTGAYLGQREAGPMDVGLIFEHSANPKNAYGALSFARVTL